MREFVLLQYEWSRWAGHQTRRINRFRDCRLRAFQLSGLAKAGVGANPQRLLGTCTRWTLALGPGLLWWARVMCQQQGDGMGKRVEKGYEEDEL
jgi:hypothetical protein